MNNSTFSLVEDYPDYYKKKPVSKLQGFFSRSPELPSKQELSVESLLKKQRLRIGELQQENEILRKAMHLLTK
ncbi:hypothetical protein [Paenibacillus borealis]|uniref:Uncharacterized protein n=1 Tax=Paenibacillus borealis TaxID=160799 RepID=A0A089L5A4_PAEBO|nr:hypothetical protein [Paenibacillus borealis]AIQ56661.1 hypothetical protein PBOR_06685 [Paenibacillus borealis]